MTTAKQNFETHLQPYKGKPELSFLQLGTYIGDATIWLMKNILTDDSSTLVDVDTWLGSDEEEHNKMDFEKVFNLYRDRTSKYNPRLRWFRGRTLDFLRYEEKKYDFVYIDADHTAVGVLLDAELSWDLVKSGGIVAFDDYEWHSGKGLEYDPQPGINTFLIRHNGEFDVIQKDWQIWIRKR